VSACASYGVTVGRGRLLAGGAGGSMSPGSTMHCHSSHGRSGAGASQLDSGVSTGFCPYDRTTRYCTVRAVLYDGLSRWDPASRFSIPPQKSAAAAAAAGRVLAPKHKFVLWGALLNRRSRQQKIPVGMYSLCPSSPCNGASMHCVHLNAIGF
jgi:hypothetical protein